MIGVLPRLPRSGRSKYALFRTLEATSANAEEFMCRLR
jgi:hypothetical protein